MLKYLAVFVLLAQEAAVAGSISKCVDASGAITFSQHGCADGGAGQEVEAKAAPRPSGEGPAVKMADPSTLPVMPKTRTTYNHCGDLTQVDIAHATAHGKIITGMTGRDVREIWGAPAQINQTADGDQWVYPIDEYRNRYLYVDTRGCFTYWN